MRMIVFPLLMLSLSFAPDKGKNPSAINAGQLERALKPIPGGTFIHGPLDMQRPFHAAQPDGSSRVEVGRFHISENEVTNGEYVTFLDHLKAHDTEKWKLMLPDTMVWTNPKGYMSPYVELYLRHPEFSNRPVVGVTHGQAMAYCDWLTEQYRLNVKRRFPNARFRLPTEIEWCYAAAGGIELSAFPWGGNNLENGKGGWMANFKPISQNCIGRMRVDSLRHEVYVAAETGSAGRNSSSSVWMPMPVRSFSPNGFGLYDMSGNVEEFVLEKGISKGGSWDDTGFYLQIWVKEEYDTTSSASCERGFRVMMETE